MSEIERKNRKILTSLAEFMGIEEIVMIAYDSSTPAVVISEANQKYFKALKKLSTDQSIEIFMNTVDDEAMLPGESIETAKKENFFIRWAETATIEKDSNWKDALDFLSKNGYRLKCAFIYMDETNLFVQIEEDPNWRTGKYRGSLHGKSFGIGESHIHNFDQWLNECHFNEMHKVEPENKDDWFNLKGDNWLNEDFDVMDPMGKFKGMYSEFRIDKINEDHAEALKKFIKDFPGDYVQVCERNKETELYDYLMKKFIGSQLGWIPSDKGLFGKYDKNGSLTYSYKEKPFPVVIDWYKGHNGEYLFFLRKEDIERILHEIRGHVHGKTYGL